MANWRPGDKRKSPGEATVYQRARDLLWVGYVILPDGKRQYVSSKKKSEAIRKRAAAGSP